jgi:nicotinamidase-related amidase
MFDRAGSLSMEGFDGSGADFLDEYKPYILDGETVIASPHKIWGPQTNDLTLQLRKRRVSQIILAGMSANLCVESHLRQFLEEGFEVAVVKDATASPRIPGGDGYLAAVTNFEFLAHAVWTTEETLGHLKRAGREATS